MSSPGPHLSSQDPGAVTTTAPGGTVQLLQSTPPCRSPLRTRDLGAQPPGPRSLQPGQVPQHLQEEPPAQRKTQACHGHTTSMAGMSCRFWASLSTLQMSSCTRAQGRSKLRLFSTNDQTAHSPGGDTAGQAPSPLKAPGCLCSKVSCGAAGQ